MRNKTLSYIAKWRTRLYLDSWAIACEWDAPDVVIAESVVDEDYRRIKLRFAPDFPNVGNDVVCGLWLTPEKSVLHELCHAITSPLSGKAICAIEDMEGGRQITDSAKATIKASDETVTEHIARIVWESWEGTKWDA